jgi:hypothetical protein
MLVLVPTILSFNKDLYDLFYEGNEPNLDPPGLFDYSKGQWTAVTASTVTYAWDAAGYLLPSAYNTSTPSLITQLLISEK